MARQTRILVWLAAFLVASIVLIASNAHGAPGKDPRPDVHEVHESDPEMNAAMAEAQSSVDPFVERLPILRADGVFFSVKFPLTENGEIEHVWINRPEFDGRHFFGLLASEPVNLPSWSYGDKVAVKPDRISDWLAIVDGTLYGGFTLYVLDRRISPAERKVLYQGLGVALTDGPIIWD